MFRSPTCTEDDRKAAEALAAISGIQIKDFAEELFHAGSNLKNRTPEEMIYQDFKTYSINGVSFAAGQNTFMNSAELQETKEKLQSYLNDTYRRNDIDMTFLMLTNILEESTELLYHGEGAKEIAETAFKVSTAAGSLSLPGVVSRKKQLIPALMSVLQEA